MERRNRSKRKGAARLAAASILAALVLFPGSGAAFKFDTHVWVAQKVLNDVLDDGKVTIGDLGAYAIDPGVVQALKNHPWAFRLGSIGPDGFPDMVGGQLTTHPGSKTMPTDEWLRWMLVASQTNEVRKAFALGYVAHAAGDVFSHTYVNTYCGDHFSFTDGEIEVEARHMAIEDYIKQRTPPMIDLLNNTLTTYGSVNPPSAVARSALADFLRDRLILNSTVANEYRGTGALHLSSMHDFSVKLAALIGEAKKFQSWTESRVNSLKADIDSLTKKIQDTKDKIPGYPEICALGLLDPTIASLCLTIESLQGSLKAAKDSLTLFNQLNALALGSLVVPLELWHAEVKKAIREYIVTSLEVLREIMKPNGDPLARLQMWFCKWGGVFMAVPSAVTTPGCVVNDFIATKVENGITALEQKLGFFVVVFNPVALLHDELKTQFKNFGPQLASTLLGKSTLTDVINMRLLPAGPTQLNQVFRFDGSCSGGATNCKHLIEFNDVASRVDAEMHLTTQTVFSPTLQLTMKTFSPEKYNVVYNTILLVKLALLGRAELNALAKKAGVKETAYGASLYPASSGVFNILLGMVRSIDGSHQWQENALPYPRHKNYPHQPPPGYLNYGYGFDKGLHFWQDCEARIKVFQRIFHGPLAPGVEAPASLGLPHVPNYNHPWTAAFPSTDGIGIDVNPPVADKASLPTVTGQCSAKVTTVPTATDACVGKVKGKTTGPLTFTSQGTYFVDWTYTDSQGNTGKAQEQKVVVKDTIPPVVTPPAAAAAEQTSLDGTPVPLGTGKAIDNCDGAISPVSNALSVYPLGTTKVVFKATDTAGNNGSASTSVTVKDTTAPKLSAIPTSVTGLEQTSLAGTPFALSLPVATDICDAAPKVNSNAPAIFPLGTTDVTFTALDASGNAAKAVRSVTVVDTTPPKIGSVVATPDLLWPPNHEMVTVTVAVAASDICDVAPACWIKAVTSNEPINGTDDGNTSPDWMITADLSTEIRAERSGIGTGRVYTIEVNCADASGNVATAATQVKVPLSKGK